MRLLCLPLLGLLAVTSHAAEGDIKALLAREIVGPRQSRLDVTEFIRGRIPKMHPAKSAEDWNDEANRLRSDIFSLVIFRGEAVRWRGHMGTVKWLDTIEG